MGFDGFVHIVKCKMYSKIEHIILISKRDSLKKLVGWRKVDRPMKGVEKGEWYTSNNCKHKKNQAIYAFKGRKFVL